MTSPETSVDPGTAELVCDFCGEPTRIVRRIALDESYERLRTPHRERYACPRCSDKKERSRLGLDRS